MYNIFIPKTKVIFSCYNTIEKDFTAENRASEIRNSIIDFLTPAIFTTINFDNKYFFYDNSFYNFGCYRATNNFSVEIYGQIFFERQDFNQGNIRLVKIRDIYNYTFIHSLDSLVNYQSVSSGFIDLNIPRAFNFLRLQTLGIKVDNLDTFKITVSNDSYVEIVLKP